MLDVLFEGQALWFSVPALLGTGVFLFLVAMMLLGTDGGDGFDADTGSSFDGSDSTQAFELLSVQGVSAFLMGFGWVGIGGLLGANWSAGLSFGVATLGGFIMVWILGALLKSVRGLESKGNVAMEDAVGKTGEVYSRIPPRGEGRGQVRVVLSSRQRMYNAVSVGPELTTHDRVVVLQVNDDNTITVGPE
jgi:membrane protein implicated in regulation of membrane protease activity